MKIVIFVVVILPFGVLYDNCVCAILFVLHQNKQTTKTNLKTETKMQHSAECV